MFKLNKATKLSSDSCLSAWKIIKKILIHISSSNYIIFKQKIFCTLTLGNNNSPLHLVFIQSSINALSGLVLSILFHNILNNSVLTCSVFALALIGIYNSLSIKCIVKCTVTFYCIIALEIFGLWSTMMSKF